MHPTIQYINKTHPKVSELLINSFGVPVDKLLVRFEDWDTQTTLDAVNGNVVIATLNANLHKNPADMKRINKCVSEIQKNNSWLHPIVLLKASSIPWPELKSPVPIKKNPFDSEYFLLDGSHRCRALSDLLAEDKVWRSKIHKVAIAYM